MTKLTINGLEIRGVASAAPALSSAKHSYDFIACNTRTVTVEFCVRQTEPESIVTATAFEQMAGTPSLIRISPQRLGQIFGFV